MRLLLSPPSLDDLIRLLRAWRYWLAAAILGGLIGAAVFQFVPPPYRARATVLVDFNLEESWPAESDRQQFYYLEREARKLEEIAWSDAVLAQVDETGGLRDQTLQLGQPAEGGWHFYAEDDDPARAQSLASAWALAFVDAAQENIATSQGLNAHIQLQVTQAAGLPTKRGVPISAYLLAGMLSAWLISSFAFLFFDIVPVRAAPASKPAARAKRKSR